MRPEQWGRIDALFHKAIECPPEERAGLLDRECSGDPSLRKEVESLIRLSDETGETSFRVAFLQGVAEVIHQGENGTPASPLVSLIGKQISHYQILSLLGTGGMGSVFLARDTTLHRQVAFKILDRSRDEATPRTRLLREARNAAALNHPYICTIHEVGEEDGTAFIAMEYVEGRSLREHLDHGPLGLEDAVRYGMEASEALAYAHDHGVVHRDFKAANVIVDETGRLTVVDFGLARRNDLLITDGTTIPTITTAAVAAGTPYAMAPEQVRGEATDERTDVWALGVLLHEMVSGVKPFDAPTMPDLFSSILRDRPAPLPDAVPVALSAVIDRCLAKEPGHRYQDAKDVHAALKAVESGVLPKRTSSRYRIGRLPWVVAGLAFVVISALLAWNVGSVRDWVRRAPPDASPITLAVLPFENLTGDPTQEYFSDGLTEELISQLGRLQPERLHVIARTSSMRYKHTNTPIDQIGGALRAQYVIEGSARREGDRVRISATLIRVSDQTQRWTDTFEREFAGVLGVQSEVSKAVAGSLALRLLPGVKNDLGGTKLVNPEAYEAYLAGRSHAIRLTRPDLDRAEKYFNLALSKDPRYALGYVGLSLVWSARQQMQFVPPEEAGPRVKATALKALDLDETLPEAHLALATTYAWTDWNWSAAEPEFRRAIELRPNYAEARAYYSHYLYIMKRPAEAQEQIRRAMELDPLSEFVKSFYSVSLFLTRRFELATVQLRDVLETNPNSPMALTGLSESLHYMQRYDEALAVERSRWSARGDREIDEALQGGYREGGYTGAMRRAADLLAARSATSKVLPLAVAKLYARAGQTDREIEWLEKAVETRDPNVPYIGIVPNFEHLHAVPRFQRLLVRLNLPM